MFYFQEGLILVFYFQEGFNISVLFSGWINISVEGLIFVLFSGGIIFRMD